jgi:hypothetical protein
MDNLQEFKLPPGWDQKSVEKFARSLTGKTKKDHKGFFRACVAKMKDVEGMDNPEAFCASLKDRYLKTTKWRSKESMINEILEGTSIREVFGIGNMSDVGGAIDTSSEGPTGGTCVCTECGYETQEKVGMICEMRSCPSCGAYPMRKKHAVVDDVLDTIHTKSYM